ncbi:hypothetical protein LQE92_14110 [Lacrimispora sp. NSJ-141]|uniref:4-hydroxythreonine-4-phosphate dehydrogenase n=1 Tax=Lientehia hominis TaxID=2897778 RepID=A0AAP2RLW6_9FIRM|nr:hypothetical protein [Lientehia hominis]MCD2493740.1 hypothetical protein [Lientehia hominis]
MNSERPYLVIMLTHNDKTVENALEIFEACRDLDVLHWGFKNVGLPAEKMKELVQAIKKAGKVTHMEVVTYSEEECLEAADLAIECGFDYLLGTVYYPSVHEKVRNSPVKFFPFCGKVWGSPSVLGETVEEIVADAKRFEKLGLDGTDLLAYRFIGNADELIKSFKEEITFPVLIAGSVDSYERIDFMKQINPWGFTMGSALFTKKFVKDGTFRENLEEVISYLEK